MAKRRRRRYTEQQAEKLAEQAAARMHEIHDHHTPEAITERLREHLRQQGPMSKEDQEDWVRAEVEQGLAEYRGLDEEFGTSGLGELALREVEGLERIVQILGEQLEGSRRTGGRLR